MAIEPTDNTFLNPDVITSESLMHFVNELRFVKLINREFEKKFAVKGAKIGDSIRLREPLQFEEREGRAVQLQPLEDRSRTMQLDKQIGVDCSIPSSDFTLHIDQFSKRYLQPQMRRLANKIDTYFAELSLEVPNFVGTPGTTPATLYTYQQARAKLISLGTPEGEDMHAILDPFAEAKLIDALGTRLNPDKEISKQYRTGKMAEAVGLSFHSSNNTRRHTIGTLGGTPQVDGNASDGNSVLCKGAGGAVSNYLRAGDIVAFSGCEAVNPLTGDSTGELRLFRVASNVNSDGGGAFTITLDPVAYAGQAIVSSGAYKTVTAPPANNAVVYVFGSDTAYAGKTTPQSLVFIPDFATGAIVGLEKPMGASFCSYKADEDAGISLRFAADWEVRTDLTICRFDVLVGRRLLNGDFACRVVG